MSSQLLHTCLSTFYIAEIQLGLTRLWRCDIHTKYLLCNRNVVKTLNIHQAIDLGRRQIDPIYTDRLTVIYVRNSE